MYKVVLLDKDEVGFDSRWYWNGFDFRRSSIDNWKGYHDEATAKANDKEVLDVANAKFKNWEILVTPWEEFSWLFQNGERPNGFHKIVLYDLDETGFNSRWYWNGFDFRRSSIDNWKGYFNEANEKAKSKEVVDCAAGKFKNYKIFLCPWEEFSSTPVE